MFPVQYSLVARHLRDLFSYAIAAMAAPAFIALAVKLVLPRRRMLIAPRAALFLIATLALAPGLVTNVILKDNWGRPRPIEVTEFDGPARFVPWWDPRGACDKNCSFVAGEGAGGFWTLAPAALAPPAWRAAGLCGAASRSARRRAVAPLGRRALRLRRGVFRRVHVSHHLARSRPDLSLAGDAAHRRAGRGRDRARSCCRAIGVGTVVRAHARPAEAAEKRLNGLHGRAFSL